LKEKDYVLVYKARGKRKWGGTSFSTHRNTGRQFAIRKAEKICEEKGYRPKLLFLARPERPFTRVYEWKRR